MWLWQTFYAARHMIWELANAKGQKSSATEEH
jgi:hypothetical protein